MNTNKILSLLNILKKIIKIFAKEEKQQVFVSQAGLNFIKKHEGLRLKAYQCPAKKWTIGYGNTFYKDGTPVKKGDVITNEQAEEMLIEYINNKVINQTRFPSTLKQNQIDAYVSFAFNCGSNTPQRARLELNELDALRKHWLLYNKVNGKVNKGLTKRRKEELNLFNN